MFFLGFICRFEKPLLISLSAATATLAISTAVSPRKQGK